MSAASVDFKVPEVHQVDITACPRVWAGGAASEHINAQMGIIIIHTTGVEQALLSTGGPGVHRMTASLLDSASTLARAFPPRSDELC